MSVVPTCTWHGNAGTSLAGEEVSGASPSTSADAATAAVDSELDDSDDSAGSGASSPTGGTSPVDDDPSEDNDADGISDNGDGDDDDDDLETEVATRAAAQQQACCCPSRSPASCSLGICIISPLPLVIRQADTVASLSTFLLITSHVSACSCCFDLHICMTQFPEFLVQPDTALHRYSGR